MLQDPRRVEIMHVAPGSELLVDRVDLLDEGAALRVGIPHRAEAVPEGDEDYLGGGVCCVDGINEFDV